MKHDGKLGEYYNPDTYSFLEIQRKSGSDWKTAAKDDDPYTYFDWKRTGGSLSLTSEVTITWDIRNAEPGTYRILYHGLAKSNYLIMKKYLKFTGTSNSFILGGEGTGLNELLGKQTYQTEISARIINSFRPKIQCTLRLSKSQHVKISLITIGGKLIRRLSDKKFKSGSHLLNYNMENYPGGAYLIVVKTKTTCFSKFLSFL
jgi:hypothetical protein